MINLGKDYRTASAKFMNRQHSSDEEILSSENDYSNEVDSATYDSDSSSESHTSEHFFKREGNLLNIMMVSNRQGADDEEKIGSHSDFNLRIYPL